MAVPDVENLIDWDTAADEVEAVMRKYYSQLMELATGDASDLLGSTLTFDISNPRIKDVIDSLATQIRNVAETTRDDVRRWVEQGTEDGLSVQKIAEQIRANTNGISASRSLTIAVTETGTAYNLGALLSYEDAGVSKVDVLDGDEDEICAEANGQRWTVEQAAAEPLAHPRCTRVFVPVVE